ncbi:MAG TPA: PAS domain S-box protein, partial [Spirochaetes bacterium]|nr:PAS domain S-box protein [Spirochaetota bacterium]
TRVLTKDGSSRWIEMNLSLATHQGAPAIIGSAMDTTDRRLHEQEMERSLVKKNILLKEIHHRVKNNMQIITSLMNLQADSLEDGAPKGIFDSCRSRVLSMALIHETLYSSSRFSDIDLKDYLERLVREIGMAYSRWDVTITLDAEPLRVDLDRAIPCGLILNELITNSLKHGFPASGGAINISALTESGKVRITVKDTGAGYETGRAAGGLGMQLVDILTTQLRGEFSVERDGGTVSVLTFQLENGAE